MTLQQTIARLEAYAMPNNNAAREVVLIPSGLINEAISIFKQEAAKQPTTDTILNPIEPVVPHQMPDGRPLFGEDSPHDIKQYLEHVAKQPQGDVERRLKTAIGGLRSIAYGDASTWPNCSSREVAKQTLRDCGGEKNPDNFSALPQAEAQEVDVCCECGPAGVDWQPCEKCWERIRSIPQEEIARRLFGTPKWESGTQPQPDYSFFDYEAASREELVARCKSLWRLNNILIAKKSTPLPQQPCLSDSADKKNCLSNSADFNKQQPDHVKVPPHPFTEKELKQIRPTVGAMRIQMERNGLWQPWWIKFVEWGLSQIAATEQKYEHQYHVVDFHSDGKITERKGFGSPDKTEQKE